MSEKPARREREPRPAPVKEPDKSRDQTPLCDLCGQPMYELHRRIICPACGYQRDCSDP